MENGKQSKKKRRAKGEGSIAQRADGRWLASLTVGIQDNGKPKKAYRYGATEKEALDKLNQLKIELGLGIDPAGGGMTVGEWCNHWVDCYKSKLKPTTKASYKNNIRTHILPTIGGVKLNKLTMAQVQYALNLTYKGEGTSNSLFIKVYNVLNGALEQAKKNKLIVDNPCKGVYFPAEKDSDRKAFTVEEQKRFIKALEGEPFRCLYLFYLYTGARMGEATPLTWEDIDLEEGTVSINKKAVVVPDYDSHTAIQHVQDFLKTKASRRTVVMTPGLVAVLKQHQEEQQKQAEVLGLPWDKTHLVFPNRNGSIPYARNVQATFSRICRNAGIEGMTVHGLRHTYCTRLAEQNVSVKFISSQLGHKSVKTTMDIYMHLFKEGQDMEIEKLGEVDNLIA